MSRVAVVCKACLVPTVKTKMCLSKTCYPHENKIEYKLDQFETNFKIGVHVRFALLYTNLVKISGNIFYLIFLIQLAITLSPFQFETM